MDGEDLERWWVRAIGPGVTVDMPAIGPGNFEFSLEPGTYILQAGMPGRTMGVSEELTLRSGDRKREVVIHLPPGATLRGKVVREDGKAPEEGTRIRLRPERNLRQEYEAFTDEGGAFEIPNLAPVYMGQAFRAISPAVETSSRELAPGVVSADAGCAAARGRQWFPGGSGDR